MPTIRFIQRSEFERVLASESLSAHTKLGLVADMCRLNTLSSVKRAGSGHLGSSFSAMDVLVLLYFQEMNVRELGWEDPNRDIFFSSKGHDVPGTYSVLYALGGLPEEQFLRLRRKGGTPGHPDVSVPGIEANSGSLGMGISKGKGMAIAKRLGGHQGHVYVMTGDGELQEGQIYESLASACHWKLKDLTVIVDHNKVQSDQLVAEINDLHDIGARFASFGWKTERCDGHDLAAVEAALGRLRDHDGPGVLVADTIKGRGVSFMEHPVALETNEGLYPWHAGAPADEPFEAGHAELAANLQERFARADLGVLALVEPEPIPKGKSGVTREYVANAYGQALADAAADHPELVVLDADLTADCRLGAFKERYPDRFVQHGIAEQDMASVAGGLALQGYLPVVNTFATFLAARANEQIYANATERTKIIYACHYAGMIPAGPGHSHQSVRDISLFAALPEIRILQPCSSEESEQVVRYCVEQAPCSTMIRLVIGPSPRRIELPEGYTLREGRGCILHDGDGVVLFAYGPVMLNEALGAAEQLGNVRVVNMPWLNLVDDAWLKEVTGDLPVVVLEDHSTVGGLGDRLLEALQRSGLSQRRFLKLGVDGVPACGTPPEALAAHGLDAASLAKRLAELA